MRVVGRQCAIPAMLFALLAALSSYAQTYPARPIRMIVPFSPGGATDVPAQILGQRMSEALAQQVIVDNRPGAGSVLGADAVTKANPDGYTLLLTATTHVISASLYKKLPYSAIRDFAAIIQIGSGPNVLTVNHRCRRNPSLSLSRSREAVPAKSITHPRAMAARSTCSALCSCRRQR